MTRLEIARKHSCLPRDVSGPAISPRRQHRVSAVNTEGIEFHRSLLEQEDYSIVPVVMGLASMRGMCLSLYGYCLNYY